MRIVIWGGEEPAGDPPLSGADRNRLSGRRPGDCHGQDRPLAVSRDGDWNGWIAFFLHAVEEQAGANGRKAKAILDLYDEMKQTVPEVTRSQYAIAAIDALFGAPIFIPSEFYEQTGIPKKTANRLLQQLREQERPPALQTAGPAEIRRPGVHSSSGFLWPSTGRL